MVSKQAAHEAEKRKTHKQVRIWVPNEAVDELDRVRGDRSRQEYVTQLVYAAICYQEPPQIVYDTSAAAGASGPGIIYQAPVSEEVKEQMMQEMMERMRKQLEEK